MKKFLLALILIFASTAHAKSLLIGYLGYWNVGVTLDINKVPGDLLTHAIYGMLAISENGECQVNPKDKPNPQGEPTVLYQFHLLKRKYPKLALMVGVGGWSGSEKFSEIASKDTSRRKFVQSCVGLIKKYNLDGIDLDWEYPVTGGLPTDSKSQEDSKNFVLLMKEFRKELGSKKALSAAVAAYRGKITNIDVKAMSEIADWLGIMAYDFRGPGSKTTGHHSNLFPSKSNPESLDQASAKTSIESFIAGGAKPDKLVLGIPFYGHSWSQVVDGNHGLFQKFTSVPKTRLGDGAVNYQEIQDQYLKQGVRYFDEEAQVPWIYNSKNKTMVSYEDPVSIQAKASYSLKMGLKGIMLWELSHDNDQNELLKTLANSLNK